MLLYLRIFIIFSIISTFSFGAVINVRFGEYKEKDRIVLDLNEKKKFRVFTLESPQRLVIDVYKEYEIERINLPSRYRYRIGKHHWGLRIVIEQPFKISRIRAFHLPNPYRIVVDVYKAGVLNKGKLYKENRREVIYDSEETKIVVIDAGHGGHDPGAIGFLGIKEKTVNLLIAKKIANKLKKDGRFKVILTRKDDRFIPLHERAKIALRNRADLFISIHADAAPKHKRAYARGTHIFAISSRAAKAKKIQIIRDREYAKLVFGENINSLPLRRILADLAIDVTMSESIMFSKILAKEISKNMGREVKLRGIKRAGFAVLKTPGIPSVLIEVGFITNPKEAVKISTSEFQEKFAESVYKAVVKYFFGEEKYQKIARRE